MNRYLCKTLGHGWQTQKRFRWWAFFLARDLLQGPYWLYYRQCFWCKEVEYISQEEYEFITVGVYDQKGRRRK